MISREQWRSFADSRPVQLTLFVLGVLMILASPLLGPVPGPGGIILFGAGLSLVLKTSLWAKRHYVRFKRWKPRAGRWTDWGLRRQSAKRREAIAKERAGGPEEPLRR